MYVRIKKDDVCRILAKKNKSQYWLALEVKTTTGYMSQLITGVRNPSPEMREKIQCNLNRLGEYQFDDLFEIVE